MRNFNHNEFDSPDVIGSGLANMNETFLGMLDSARDEAGVSFNISSGYRTPSHNKKVGGKSGSSHTLGLAADIVCVDSRARFLMLKALINVGFSRIGIAENFIHVDYDTDKADDVAWTY